MPENSKAPMRRQRLAAWIKDHHGGVQADFLESLRRRGHRLNHGELSGLLGKKTFGEKKARKLEQAAGMPEMHLEGGAPLNTAKEAPKSDLDITALQVMVQALFSALIASAPDAAKPFADSVDGQLTAIRDKKYPWFSDVQGVIAPSLQRARSIQQALEGADRPQSRRGSGR